MLTKRICKCKTKPGKASMPSSTRGTPDCGAGAGAWPAFGAASARAGGGARSSDAADADVARSLSSELIAIGEGFALYKDLHRYAADTSTVLSTSFVGYVASFVLLGDDEPRIDMPDARRT